MANNFDRFPLGDALVKKNTLFISSTWNAFMETFYENLVSYLTRGGVILPNLDQTQIDRLRQATSPINSIQSPANGQLLYNTTIDATQFYLVSTKSWRTISFT